MADLSEIDMLFAKPFITTVRALAFSPVVHVNDNGVKVVDFFDGKAR